MTLTWCQPGLQDQSGPPHGGRGVAIACWTVGGHSGRGPGNSGAHASCAHTGGGLGGATSQRGLGGRGLGPGRPGGAQRGPLCPVTGPVSVGCWGGHCLAPEAGLGSEPMRPCATGPRRAEAGAVSPGSYECPAPSAPHRQVAAVNRGCGRPVCQPCVHKDAS